ncbi:MAG: hypothetical protein ACLQGV_14540 [Bryobacteraceae bacterium]
MKLIKWILLFAIVAVVLLVAVADWPFWPPVKFKATYQAVLLSNGAVYFGKLEGLGTDYPILRDVFYIQNAVDPNTKQTSSVLIRRGKEWHGPDFMVLNARNIVLIEPVTQGSRVAQLIAAAPK